MKCLSFAAGIVVQAFLASLPSGAAQTPLLLSGTHHPSMTGAGDSLAPVASGNGTVVVFVSTADNLVTNDTNGGLLDVLVADLDTSVLRLVSVNTNGASGNGPSRNPAVSDDGRWIAFVSDATDLVDGDTNGVSDVFLRDMLLGATLLVSANDGGAGGNRASDNPVLSADGGWVVFESLAGNLAPKDTNRLSDVFLRDVVNGQTRWISQPSTHPALRNRPSGISDHALLSADGTTVVFAGTGVNLAPGLQTGGTVLTNNQYFLRPPATTNRMVNVAPGGAVTPGVLVNSGPAAISADGRYVALLRRSSNTNALPTRVLRVDLDSGEAVELMSTLIDGLDAGRYPLGGTAFVGPFLSADGRRVVVEGRRTIAPGLELPVVVSWDPETGESTRVSSHGWQTQGDGTSSEAPWGHLLAASRNGDFVAFLGASTNDPPDGPTNQIVLRRLSTGERRRVSRTSSGEPTAENAYPAVTLSDDGRKMTFQSREAGLVEGDSNNAWDVFVYDWDRDEVQLVSRRNGDRPSIAAAGSSRLEPGALSAKGSLVVYQSPAADLVPDDENGFDDVFLRDTGTGLNRLVSVRLNGTSPANGASRHAVLSADGRFVAFTSNASDLVDGDTNRVDDIFLRDTVAGTTVLVSRRPDGRSSGLGASERPSISPDGRYVAFESLSGELDPADQNNIRDVYLYDAASKTIRLVSRNALGTGAGNGVSGNAVLSPDGDWVVFETRAGDLTLPQSNDRGRLVMAWDVATGEMHRLTPSDAEEMRSYPGPAPVAVFSPEGRFAAYTRTILNGTVLAADLIELATGERTRIADRGVVTAISRNATRIAYRALLDLGSPVPQAWILDRQAGTATRISASPAGEPANRRVDGPLLTSDGRFAVFATAADNLAPDDSNGVAGLFVRDLETGSMIRLGSRGWSVSPVLSQDGRTLVFASAGDIISDDFNGEVDLYLVQLPGPESEFRITSVTRLQTGEVTLVWPVAEGIEYGLEASADLTSGWTRLLVPIQVQGGQATAIDPDGASLPRRFYRLIQ